MKSIIASFLSAVLFGLGLGLAGMTLPEKVLGFLDVTGDWNMSLAFVMVGAIATHAITYRFISKRTSPILAPVFQIPTRRDIDRPLLLGAAIFGIGWGLGGFCPGPALVTMTTGVPGVLAFVLSMIAAIYLFRFYQNHLLTPTAGKSNDSRR